MLQEYCPRQKYTRVTSDDLIYERGLEIERIEEDMNEVYEITKELDEYVTDQDDDIMHIEDTILNSHDNIKKGAEELKNAHRKSKWFLTIIISSIIIGIIFLII